MVSYEKLLQGNYTKRFWSKVDKTGSCWNWTASKSTSGYGKFSVTRSNWIEAHRISYFIENGEIPNGMLVCHKCDNKICVNPDHLFIGTYKDNLYDCMAKGRFRTGSNPDHGEKHINSKLTNEMVFLIRKYKSEGWALRDMSDLFKVSQSLISMIINGKRWKHI